MSENISKKKNKNGFLILVLVLIVLIAAGFTFWRARAFFLKPLAAPLTMQIQSTPTAEDIPAPATVAPVVALAPTSAPTPLPGTCGQSGVMTVLVLARDLSNGNPPFGADLIRFARIDFNNKTVRLIALPRDLWVATPHLASLNLDHSRLGPVYYQVEQTTPGTQDQIANAATSAVAQAIYDNYGVTADHYIFFEMQYFAQALDQLGGLDVNVPADVTDGKITFYAGQQHLDGARSLDYARVKVPGGEIIGGWDRMDRQNQVLKLILGKLLEPANLVKVPALLQQFQNDFTTDLSPEQLTSLTCMVDKVSPDQITNLQVDKTMITGPGPDDSMLPNTEMIKQFLQTQLAP